MSVDAGVVKEIKVREIDGAAMFLGELYCRNLSIIRTEKCGALFVPHREGMMIHTVIAGYGDPDGISRSYHICDFFFKG